MPATNMTELKNEITPEQEAQMARIEGLIELRRLLIEDETHLRDTLQEMVEERREMFVSLSVNITPIQTAVDTLIAAVKNAQTEAKTAQFHKA